MLAVSFPIALTCTKSELGVRVEGPERRPASTSHLAPRTAARAPQRPNQRPERLFSTLAFPQKPSTSHHQSQVSTCTSTIPQRLIDLQPACLLPNDLEATSAHDLFTTSSTIPLSCFQS